MFGKMTKNHWLSTTVTLCLCLLCVGTAYRYTSMIVEVLILLVLGLAWFMQSKKEWILEKNEKLLIFAFIFFFVSALLSYVIGCGWELRSIRNPSMPSLIDLDLPSKYLLGALVFFLYLKLDFHICKKALFYAIGLGGIVNGCIAIYERYVLGVGRVDAWSGIAEFADASALLAIFALIFLLFSQCRKERIFYSLAVFMACFASFLTATRGAMLGIILTFIFIGGIIFWKRREMTGVLLSGFLFVALAIVVNVVASGGIKDSMRLQEATTDLQSYTENNAHTSIGMRFEMWKEAITMFKMAPFFGLSSAEIAQRMPEILQDSGSQLDRLSMIQNDARGNKHNQILNQAAKRGLVGVLAILLIWFASIKLFSSSLSGNDSILALAMCGICMTFYFIFPNSFTGEPWESNVSFPLMTLLICAFWKEIKAERAFAN